MADVILHSIEIDGTTMIIPKMENIGEQIVGSASRDNFYQRNKTC